MKRDVTGHHIKSAAISVINRRKKRVEKDSQLDVVADIEPAACRWQEPPPASGRRRRISRRRFAFFCRGKPPESASDFLALPSPASLQQQHWLFSVFLGIPISAARSAVLHLRFAAARGRASEQHDAVRPESVARPRIERPLISNRLH